jgi:uncharacterized protein YkwD
VRIGLAILAFFHVGCVGIATFGADPTPPPPTPTADEIPAAPYCDPTRDWDPSWAAFEDEVLELVNAVRAQGQDCGSEGSFGAVQPLTMEAHLRCAARMHSLDMADRGFFEHVNPEGESAGDRLAMAGYPGFSAAGENIAQGPLTPESAVGGWLTSDGHCANIMLPGYHHIGVGFYPGSGDTVLHNMWTQTFATPVE